MSVLTFVTDWASRRPHSRWPLVGAVLFVLWLIAGGIAPIE